MKTKRYKPHKTKRNKPRKHRHKPHKTKRNKPSKHRHKPHKTRHNMRKYRKLHHLHKYSKAGRIQNNNRVRLFDASQNISPAEVYIDDPANFQPLPLHFFQNNSLNSNTSSEEDYYLNSPGEEPPPLTDEEFGNMFANVNTSSYRNYWLEYLNTVKNKIKDVINDEIFMHEYSIEWLLLTYDNENQTISNPNIQIPPDILRQHNDTLYNMGSQNGFPTQRELTNVEFNIWLDLVKNEIMDQRYGESQEPREYFSASDDED